MGERTFIVFDPTKKSFFENIFEFHFLSAEPSAHDDVEPTGCSFAIFGGHHSSAVSSTSTIFWFWVRIPRSPPMLIPFIFQFCTIDCRCVDKRMKINKLGFGQYFCFQFCNFAIFRSTLFRYEPV